MRKIISEMINEEPGFEVIGVARDGEEGVQRAIELRPDIITLDIEMPRKDGLSALREIKIKCHDFSPMVLMCSSLTVAGSNETFKALRIGASDFIAKDPTLVGQHDAGFREELISKLKAFSAHHASDKAEPTKGPATQATESSSSAEDIDLDRVKAIVVGSSTGGPPVLEEIFSSIPKNLRIPIIVAQHMPELFTRSLAKRLDQHCACTAQVAENGAILSTPGIHIALGGIHTRPLRVAGGKVVARHIERIDGAPYRPSVDELFSASSEIWGDALLAIQLTGMGADGANGAEKIKAAGGQVIAQLGSTCVVNGMPKAVIDKNAAHAVMAPKDIQSLLRATGDAVSGAIGPKPSSSGRLRSA
jgi:two-component system chemotaxis response regulator CheB